MDSYTILLEEHVVALLIRFWKTSGKICPLHLSEFVFKKNMGLIIIVTLVVHQTPTFKLCNRNLCISLGPSADQYLIFWVICDCLGETMHIGSII